MDPPRITTPPSPSPIPQRDTTPDISKSPPSYSPIIEHKIITQDE